MHKLRLYVSLEAVTALFPTVLIAALKLERHLFFLLRLFGTLTTSLGSTMFVFALK